eukprot:6021186-Prymnesium_polylepis.1
MAGDGWGSGDGWGWLGMAGDGWGSGDGWGWLGMTGDGGDGWGWHFEAEITSGKLESNRWLGIAGMAPSGNLGTEPKPPSRAETAGRRLKPPVVDRTALWVTCVVQYQIPSERLLFYCSWQ